MTGNYFTHSHGDHAARRGAGAAGLPAKITGGFGFVTGRQRSVMVWNSRGSAIRLCRAHQNIRVFLLSIRAPFRRAAVWSRRINEA